MSIAFQSVTKRYGGRVVFDAFTHTFPAGETTCVMGPSGCGKTTLLRLLLGLTAPDGGEITGIDGLRFSAVFQEDRLIGSLSAASNLRLVQPALTKPQAADMLDALGLAGDAHLPVQSFSGGMRQRVSLLRALAADYDVLLLDEPFHGLDAGMKSRAMRYFQEQTAGKTVVLVTHDPAEPPFLGGHLLLLETQGAKISDPCKPDGP